MKNKNKLIKEYINQYAYIVEPEDGYYVAHALEFPSIKADHETAEKAIAEIKKPLLTALEWELELGHPIPEPLNARIYSGKFTIRVSPEEHKEITKKASVEGLSMNQYVRSKVT